MADGHPIYAFLDANGNEVKSSYRLKKGSRPSGGSNPGGRYDGTFVQDYEYVQGYGDLDKCNGKTINGKYIYFLTKSFPVIPRCFVGNPDSSFDKNTRSDKRSSSNEQNSGRRRRGPPREALTACQNKNEGQSCSFSSPRGFVSGTCFKPPRKNDLACRPKHH